MASTQWIPPLPPGYEARWDPNQRAYFFINHSTKTTTWQDPRWPQRPQGQAQSQAPTHHAAAAQSLNQGNTASGGGQNVAMTTMYKQFGGTTTRTDNSADEDWEDDWDTESDLELPFKDTTGDQRKVDIAKLHQLKSWFPSAPEDAVRSALLKNNNVMGIASSELSMAGYRKEEPTSHPPPRSVDMLERLRAMFPTANKDLISDILYQANYDEKSARAQLEAIGYKAQYTPTHKTARETSPRKSASPSKKSVSPARSPVRQASPTRVTISEAQKSQLLAKLKREYKDTEESVITMALQVCDYDETRVKNLLGRMHEESETPRPSSHKTVISVRHRSPSPTPVISSGSLEPVAFDIDLSAIDRTNRPGTSTSSTRTTPDRKTPSKTSRTPTPKSSASSQRQQQRTKNVTELSEDVLSSTVDVLNHLATNVSCCQKQDNQSEQEEDLTANQNEADSRHRRQEIVVSRQPQAGTHVSEYRTVAKGPDFSLRVGPNKDLLITEYILAKGPNPDLRQGPDPGRVMGSQGAVGPDRSLWCGPQAGLSKGTSSENLLMTAV